MKSEVSLTNSGTLVLIVQATANLVLVLKPMLKQKKMLNPIKCIFQK